MPPRLKNTLLIAGGHLLDPAQNLDGPYDLLIAEGRVAEVAPAGHITKAAEERLDAQGMIVAPGFIDIHVGDHARFPRPPAASLPFAPCLTPSR